MAKKKAHQGSGVWKYIPEFQVGEKFELYNEDEKLQEFLILERVAEDEYSVTLRVLTEGGDRSQQFFRRTKAQLVAPEVTSIEIIQNAPLRPREKSETVRGVSVD